MTTTEEIERARVVEERIAELQAELNLIEPILNRINQRSPGGHPSVSERRIMRRGAQLIAEGTRLFAELSAFRARSSLKAT